MAKQDISVSGGTATIKFTTGRLIKRTEAATRKGMEKVGREIVRTIKARISRPIPPRSKRDQWIKRDSGDLHRSVKVVVRPRAKRLEIQMLNYGMFWDQGIDGVKRKVYTAAIHDKRRYWERKFNAAIRKFAK